MKSKMWTSILLGAGFAFLLSVGAVGSLVTGYDLETACVRDLFLWCAGFALVSALLFQWRYGAVAALGLAVLAAPILWKDGVLWEQLQSLCYTVTKGYHTAYGWPLLGKFITEDVNRPLTVLSAWSAVSVSWCVCRRKHALLAVPPVLLPLVLCLITTDTVPDEIYLYLLILGIALLLVTDWTRRREPAQEGRLILRAAIPVAAALALLFAANPREEYVNQAGRYQKEAVAWFQELLDAAQGISSGVSFESAASEKLNLRQVGPKSSFSYAVMRVTAPMDGTIYLRGRDYDVYSGTGWEASMDRTETFSSGGNAFGEISIVTHGVRDVLYVPYYAVGDTVLVNGAVDNGENLQSYSYALAGTIYGISDTPDKVYRELPEDTLRWASKLCAAMGLNTGTQGEKAQRIVSFVQNAARYDLSTDRMSAEYSDFAQWFLEESDTGYCVHFATAATVLLRAVGISARYVEGYMVTCKAGEEVIVYNRNAHAWVEYYDFFTHTWIVLEATPADWMGEGETEATAAATTEATEPEPIETESVPSAATTPAHAGGQMTPAGQGTATGGTEDPAVSDQPFRLPGWIKTVFWILLGAAFVMAQSTVRIAWKRKRWNGGKPNEKLLIRWRQTRKMARIVRCPFPEQLELLAQKASFSQHRIRADELLLFEDFREALLVRVWEKPWYERLLLRWVFAIG